MKMSLKNFWLEKSVELAGRKADFYSGARKIIRPLTLRYEGGLDNSLSLDDCGFTKNKLGMLTRNYYLEPSVKAAQELWNERVAKKKYGSVGFSCYAHFVKGDVGGHTPRGSKFGPCLQSVTLTLLKKGTGVDVFYRTTEWYKKFPADLVFLRDVLLKGFDFKKYPVESITFHFANVTMHPMYAITTFPHIDAIKVLEEIKRKDKFFYTWQIKWSARYICDEYSNGIKKFAQAMRVSIRAKRNIDKATVKELQRYFRKNHPKKDDDIEEDDDE